MVSRLVTNLREQIRRGDVHCTCWEHGIRPGFRVEGDVTMYTREPQGHFDGCPWAAAVKTIYREESKHDR